MAQYDHDFFDYVSHGAVRSANTLLPLLADLQLESVLDVGCGRGAWLSVWQQQGVTQLTGLDGDYVARNSLLIPAENFIATDLARPFDLDRRFSLVQSLEVAEHLPATSAAEFVDSLVRHGDLILFSAAPKGQGGENHINEQPYDYWRKLFARHGYVALDYLRPQLCSADSVEPWYRYNCFLYVSEARLAHLPDAYRAARVAEDSELPDRSPLLYRLRKRLVSLLPVAAMSWLARLKMALRARRQRHHNADTP